jgi:hypothetical protein
VKNPAAIAVGSLGLAVSVAVAGRGREHTHLSGAIGVFFLVLAALAGVVALNKTMISTFSPKPVSTSSTATPRR